LQVEQLLAGSASYNVMSERVFCLQTGHFMVSPRMEWKNCECNDLFSLF
jgi:hypothetical protein